MPELPEVETVIRTLRPLLMGRSVTGVEVFLPKVIKEPAPEEFVREMCGRRFTTLNRKGKFLLLTVANEDDARLLVVHLRMTGRLVNTLPGLERDKYTHIIFTLDNGNELRFRDIRQFGTMHLIPTETVAEFLPLQKLGPDALDPDLTEERFQEMVQGKTRRIKQLLLDQCFLAGLGNIYANEVLWQACVHPERPADTLDQEEITGIYQAIREILAKAITYRGTTLRDYADGNGQPGSFQGLLMVHAKAGEPCPICGTTILRLKCGGRSAFICPCCQKNEMLP